MKEMKLKQPDGDDDIRENPFILLGYGINAYFDILYYLFCCFTMLTIFSLPIYYLYA
jgi:hypothetical protein